MPKLYTGAGDSGETSLFGGGKVGKTHPRVMAFGEIDELNAVLGVVGAFLEDEEMALLIATIQNRLFNLGSELAAEEEKVAGLPARISPEDVSWLESKIDSFAAQLPPLKEFIIPDGVQSATFLHLARTVCRRAERAVVALGCERKLNDSIVPFLNRLSDLLFVLARCANFRAGEQDKHWLKDKPD